MDDVPWWSTWVIVRAFASDSARVLCLHSHCHTYSQLRQKQLDDLEEMLSVDIPRLMERLPKQLFDRTRELPIEEQIAAPQTYSPHDPLLTAQAQSQPAQEPAQEPPVPPPQPAAPKPNPFAKPKPNPFAKPPPPPAWVVSDKKAEFDALFETYKPVDGKLDSDQARDALIATELPEENLFSVWELADNDADGALDDEEFALAMYLCEKVKLGEDLPETLPEDWVPPKQR